MVLYLFLAEVVYSKKFLLGEISHFSTVVDTACYIIHVEIGQFSFLWDKWGAWPSKNRRCNNRCTNNRFGSMHLRRLRLASHRQSFSQEYLLSKLDAPALEDSSNTTLSWDCPSRDYPMETQIVSVFPGPMYFGYLVAVCFVVARCCY